MSHSTNHSPANAIPSRFDSYLWPVAIISAFVIFAAFIFVNVFIMMNSKTDLVSATYYKEEIEFQNQIDKRNRTLEKGKSLQYNINKSLGNIELIFPGASPATTGSLHFFRPANAAEDKVINLNCDNSGKSILPISQFGKGSWILKATWKDDNQEWYDEVKLNIEQ